MRTVGIILLVILVSCRQNVSSNIIAPEIMKQVLWDMNNADALHEQLSINDTTFKHKKDNLTFYNQVFALHHITRQQFYNSFRFYESRPDKMQALLDSSIAYGEKIKNPPVITKKDTLKHIDTVKRADTLKPVTVVTVAPALTPVPIPFKPKRPQLMKDRWKLLRNQKRDSLIIQKP